MGNPDFLPYKEGGRAILDHVIESLSTGTQRAIEEIRRVDENPRSMVLEKMRELQGFLETLHAIGCSMPDERLREALIQTILSLRNYFSVIPRTTLARLQGIRFQSGGSWPDYLVDAIRQLGPELRLAKDEMTAWISIRKEFKEFYTPDTIMESLNARGVVFGLNAATIASMLASNRMDEEVPAASGKRPQKGEDGSIQYDERIQERRRIPKLLEDGRVSFKDIDIYTFVNAGDTIATRIPARPGDNGTTVTGRQVLPIPTQEATMPSCKHTVGLDDGSRLVAEIDGCVWLENGQLRFHPTVHVRESVSYKTGNIESKVGVIVERDIPSGFSVRSERDISVGGTVESAIVESEGSILIKGGIEGNNKGCVRADGDIIVRYVSNGDVRAGQTIYVESGIVQSTVWAGKKVVVSGPDSQIVGGVIDADSSVVCDAIGSPMGVKTMIRLGRMLSDLQRGIQAKQAEIAELQRRIEQCSGLVESMQNPAAANGSIPDDVDLSLSRARATREEAEKELELRDGELQNLQSQYDEMLRTPRTICVRKTIHPGTVLEILGVQLKIKEPTGPVTVAKSGEGLVLLPYKELEE